MQPMLHIYTGLSQAPHVLCKYAGVEIHSFGSNIRNLFILEWKSTEAQNSRILSQKSDSNHYFGVDSTIILDWIQLQNELDPRYDSKKNGFYSSALR